MKFRTQDHFWAKCDRKVMLLLYGTHLIPKTNAMDHWNGAPGFQAQGVGDGDGTKINTQDSTDNLYH